MNKRKRIPYEIWNDNKDYIENQFNKYGIPYGVICGFGNVACSQKEIDRELARQYILHYQELPADLKKRLLKYKREENKIC